MSSQQKTIDEFVVKYLANKPEKMRTKLISTAEVADLQLHSDEIWKSALDFEEMVSDTETETATETATVTATATETATETAIETETAEQEHYY